MSSICDDLRAAILQAAMQGKLTEQLPEDGKAEDLLKEIRIEKEKLIVEGKIKKQRALAPIADDEIPFSIPENWRWARMTDLFTIVTGKKDANFGSDSGKYRFFTCARTPIYSNSYSFSGESILLAGNGDIGNVSYYDGNFEAYQRTYVLQPFIEHTYAEYILRHLMGNWVEYNKDKMFGTAIPYIRLSNVEEYLIAFPPLSEQKRIVKKVDELMTRVADLEQSADALASLKKAFPDDIKASLLQAAMQGKLTEQLPGDGDAEGELGDVLLKQKELLKRKEIKVGKYDPRVSDSSELPSGWKYVKLGSIASLITKQTGFDYSKNIKPSLVSSPQNNTYPLIQTRNFKGKRFMFDSKYHIPKNVAESFPNLLLNKPCLLLSIVGASIGNVGLFRKKTIGFIGGAIAKVNLIDDNYLDYVFYFLQSPMGLEQIMKNYKATAQGTITVEDVRNIEIPMPPLLEQKRIIERLDALMQNINAVGELIASE